MVEFTKSTRFEAGGTFPAATVPSDVPRMFAYFVKGANEGGAAHALRISQKRDANAFDDRTVIPANDSRAFGGNPDEDKILTFESGGTVVAALDTGQAGGAGTLDVTVGFVTPE